MHLDSTIELIESIIKDIEHSQKQYTFTRVHYDMNFAISALRDSIYGLNYAKKHIKELEKE